LPANDYADRSTISATGPPPSGALVLGPAGDEDLGVADEPRQRAGHEGAGMTGW